MKTLDDIKVRVAEVNGCFARFALANQVGGRRHRELDDKLIELCDDLREYLETPVEAPKGAA